MPSSRARADSASLEDLIFSISRRWLICASSSSWLSVRRRLVASSWVWRTEMSASASTSARFLRFTAMISASRRMPTALKALFSSSAAKAVWSMRVSDTESSRMPFCARLSRSSADTAATNSARFSCRVSIGRLAAMACTASMKRPSSRLRMPSGVKALEPIDCAAVATPSTVGCTRT